MKSKKNTPEQRKVFNFRLTLVQLVLLMSAALVVCLWMFVLGVLTGRGVIFTRVKWLGIESKQTTESVNPSASTVQIKNHETADTEDLTPEKIEKRLEFFHNLDKTTEQLERHKISSKQSPNKSGELRQGEKKSKREKFFILVASFRKGDMAKALANRLKKYGYSGNVEKVDLKEKGVWYRVCVGNYSQKSEARKHAKVIKEKFRVSPLVMLVSE